MGSFLYHSMPDKEYPVEVSLVIPLYNEEESLRELHSRIRQAMISAHYSYEVIFVDDGSTDGSWREIESLAAEYPEVRALRFARNYGKSPGLQCGFARARGRIVCTLDADLQDQPEELPEMCRLITEEGYDLVSGWKKKRYDPVLSKNLPSKLFNATARRVSGIRNLHDFNCGLKAYRHEVVKSIELYNDMHRYIPYLAKNAGFTRITEKPVVHTKRKYGVSKFGWDRYFNGYLDLLTLWFTSRFGRKPMHFFGFWGSLVFLIGVIALIVVLVTKFVALSRGIPAPLVTDRVYFYIALAAMIIGTQLFCAGFLGELLSRQYSNRNEYNIREEIGKE